VVDSVAFPFRHDFTDMLQRTRALGEMGNRLMQLAHSYDVAVCVLPAVSDDLTFVFWNATSRDVQRCDMQLPPRRWCS
jgi:Rad51